MTAYRGILSRSIIIFMIFTLLCGVVYTGAVTVLAQTIFPRQANGSLIEIDGKKYGCALLGQYYNDDKHLWGRIMNLDVSTFRDRDGNALMYAWPSNLSPASAEYEALVAARVALLQKANPERGEAAIPVDLVTCSGSGLDPHISPAAAEYQVARLARANGLSETRVRAIIAECTEGKFLGVFGEETVNTLKVNLMLDGIL